MDAGPITVMLEAVIAQITCEQSACSVAIIIAYAVAVTAAILGVIYFVRKRASDRNLR